MRLLFGFLLIAFSSCASLRAPWDPELLFTEGFSAKKQKQKIALLEKKLELAERDKKEIDEEVMALQERVQEARVALVRKLLEEYEKEVARLHEDPLKYSKFLQMEMSNLFLKERETLHQVIRKGLCPASLEAQAVLDRILRLITELSDEKKSI